MSKTHCIRSRFPSCPQHPDVFQAALNATKAKAAELANQTAIESSALVTINVYFHVISTGPDLADGNVPDQWVVAQINTMNKAYVATGFQACLWLSIHRVMCTRASSWHHQMLRISCASEQRSAPTVAATVPQFALVNISRTVNADWYGMAPQSPEEVAAKALLHRGNMRGACCTMSSAAHDSFCLVLWRMGSLPASINASMSRVVCLPTDFNLYTTAGGGNGLLGWTYFPFQNPGVLDSSVVYW